MNKKGNPSLRLIDKVKLGSGLSPFTLVTRSSSHPAESFRVHLHHFWQWLRVVVFPLKKLFSNWHGMKRWNILSHFRLCNNKRAYSTAWNCRQVCLQILPLWPKEQWRFFFLLWKNWLWISSVFLPLLKATQVFCGQLG